MSLKTITYRAGAVALAAALLGMAGAQPASASEAPCDAHPDVCALVDGNAPEWCTANAQAEDCVGNVTMAAQDLAATVRGPVNEAIYGGCETGENPGCQVVEDPVGWCEEQALGVDCPSQILALLQEIEDSQGGTLSQSMETLAGFGDFVDDAANRDLFSISLDSGCRNCGVTFYRKTDDPMAKYDQSRGNYNHKYENNMEFRSCYVVAIGGDQVQRTDCIGEVYLTNPDGARLSGRTAKSSGGRGHEVHAEFSRTAGVPYCRFDGGGSTQENGDQFLPNKLRAYCWYRYG